MDRIGVDLERLGKAARQHGLGTWLSDHSESDLERLRPAVRSARLFARVNPWHNGTPAEVERVLQCGVEVLMLPMFEGADEVRAFAEEAAGRAEVVLLLERVEALAELEDILAVPGVGELHLGLNDLALSMGVANRWLSLLDDRIVRLAGRVRAAGWRLGLGGLGRVDDTTLPIPPELVYAEHARLGATAGLLSRSFVKHDGVSANLAVEVARLRDRLREWRSRDQAELEEAHAELARLARALQTW